MIDEVDKLLTIPLNTDDGNVLMNQLAEAEAWSSTMSAQYRKAEQALKEFRQKIVLHDRDEGGNKLTEYTRKLRVDGMAAEYEATMNRYGDMCDIIQRRISLGQTLIKNMGTEVKAGLR